MTELTDFVVAAAVMTGIGGALAAILAFASRRFFVWEDPRIDEVEAMLPHANCGACGCAGCRDFAERLVAGAMAPAKCTVSSPQNIVSIAAFLGVAAGKAEKRVARLSCAGGDNVAVRRARYVGAESCRAAVLVGGGGKGCVWGCLGFGDCERACTFDAIRMNRHGLPVVVEAKCTACGDCVDACPKQLFSIQDASHRLWVACRSLAHGDEAEAECDVACTGCGKCAADAPGLIRISNNLAVVDYSRANGASTAAIERCPTGAIVWIDEVSGPRKGAAAKKIVRQSPRPVEPAGWPVAAAQKG
ncbi:MAG: 4Fe-4S binding protein [Bryobacteraceae bacterium]|nr:4Fe-4S binding protein [Bryobacteraceae bacterium]